MEKIEYDSDMIKGYNKPLFILAFDHRASFAKIFGITTEPTEGQLEALRSFKELIYRGFEMAIDMGVPKQHAAILVDEYLGEAVLKAAKQKDIAICLTTEKSGQDIFNFEYPETFADHIKMWKPLFAKALVRYNPGGSAQDNGVQLKRLKILSDFCAGSEYRFLIEPLVLPTPEQLASVGGDHARYDRQLRPGLMVEMIKQFQAAGVEPDVWKVEGLHDTASYEAIRNQAQTGGRASVGIVVLGRGADGGQVEDWLRQARTVSGVVGFAIGRTIFAEPLKKIHEGQISAEDAIKQVAKNYVHYYQVFTEGK